MSKIVDQISQQNFEVIRDQIGAILIDEIANQRALGLDILPSKIWIERFIPFSHTELPAINIMYQRTDFSTQTAYTQLGANSYYIDVYNKSKASTSKRPDVKSIINLQRMCGVIRSILMSPYYIRLGFDDPKINHRTVSQIAIAEPESRDDATSLTFGRLTVDVQCTETGEEITPVLGTSYLTHVKLHETEKGYYFELNN